MSFDVRDMERDSMAVMVPRVKGGDLRAVEDVLDELDIKADTDSLETKWVVASAEQEENKVKLRDLTIREGLRFSCWSKPVCVSLCRVSDGSFRRVFNPDSECLRGRPYY